MCVNINIINIINNDIIINDNENINNNINNNV